MKDSHETEGQTIKKIQFDQAIKCTKSVCTQSAASLFLQQSERKAPHLLRHNETGLGYVLTDRQKPPSPTETRGKPTRWILQLKWDWRTKKSTQFRFHATPNEFSEASHSNQERFAGFVSNCCSTLKAGWQELYVHYLEQPCKDF